MAFTPTFVITQGCTAPAYTATLTREDGSIVDLSTAVSVSLYVSNYFVSVITGAAAQVTNASKGQVSYEWQGSDLSVPGFYAAEWKVSWPGGATTSYPNDGYAAVTVMNNLTLGFPNVAANFNTILSGPSSPSPANGTNGDFWYNTGNGYFYGPKAGGAWPAGYPTQLSGSSLSALLSPTANFSMGGFRFTDSSSGVVSTDVATVAQLPSSGSPLPVSSGGTGGITAPAALSNLTLIVPGVVGDGATDDSVTIQNFLAAVGETTTATRIVVRSPIAGGSIYINATVQVQSSNTTLDFQSPVVFGATGRLRIYGDYVYSTPSTPPILTASAAVGATTLHVTGGSYFPVGQSAEVRGDHDATGAALWEDYFLVLTNTPTGGGNATITIDTPLQNAYSVTYSGGQNSEVVAIASSLCTGTPTRGDRTVQVASSSEFVAGNFVHMLDDSLNVSSAGAPQAQNFYNREVNQVVSIVDGSHVLLAHALHHTFSTSNNARLSVLNPVENSHITGASVTWSAASTIENAFEIHFSVSSSIQNSACIGGTYSWLNQAFRQSDSYFCFVDNVRAEFPVLTGAGQGYGSTFYGATYCTVRNSRSTACRHSFLHYYGASGNLITGCTSVDACLSDYDFHGGACMDNVVADSYAVGGDSVPTDTPSPQKAACKVGNENHIVGDFYNTFDNVTVVNSVYGGNAAGLQVVAQSGNNTFRNCRVKNASYGLWMTDNSSDTTIVTTDTIVESCTFEDCANLVNINGGTSTAVQGVALLKCVFVRALASLTILSAESISVVGCTWLWPVQVTGQYALSANTVTGLVVKNNEMSSSQRGVSLTTCPSARVTGNTMHDLINGTVLYDGGGNNGVLFADNSLYGYAPIVYVAATASNGLITASRPYFTDSPSVHGYVEWNGDPRTVSSTSRQPSAGVLYLNRFIAQGGTSISNIVYDVGQLGAGATSLADTYFGMYDSAGTLLAYSTDQSSALSTGSTGIRTVALNTSVTPAGGEVYVFALVIGTQATTPLQLGGWSTVGPANSGLSNATDFFGSYGTGQSALPGSFTPSSGSSSTLGIWHAAY